MTVGERLDELLFKAADEIEEAKKQGRQWSSADESLGLEELSAFFFRAVMTFIRLEGGKILADLASDLEDIKSNNMFEKRETH